MADKPDTFDWAEVSGRTVERLRKPKIPDVPTPIVRQAQRSYDGVQDPQNADVKLHVLEHQFENEAKAAAFAKLMKNAGHHTTPLTSVSVAVDPEDNGNTKLVRWRAGARRGRTAGN